MKKYIFTIAILSIVPSIAFASWWNPSSWFSSQNTQNNASSTTNEQIATLNSVIVSKDQEIAQLEAKISSSTNQTPIVQQKTITQTITVKDPKEQSAIANLSSQLAQAQAQYALCQGQLSSVASTTQTTNTNSAQIKSIESELALLNQIDFYIDNDPLQSLNYSVPDPLVGTSTLVNVLNNSKKLDGTMLFSNSIGEWYVSTPQGAPTPMLAPQTSTSSLHQFVKVYRIQLEGELESAGVVNQTMNLSQ
jgi:uncharacterized coiled-coil protein SlyX